MGRVYTRIPASESVTVENLLEQAIALTTGWCIGVWRRGRGVSIGDALHGR